MGEVISASDMIWTEVPTERLAQNVVTQMDALVGLAPRRDLREGAPILSGDVKKPVVVQKNTLVAMVVRTPGMTLTAQGRALEDGVQGQSIRVLNTQTKRTIQASVVSPGEVLVETAATHMASLP
jgi:flagella basal body P-ring formation protein FlgA